MLNILKGMELVDNHVLDNWTTDSTDLADYSGYDVVDQVSIELSNVFYGDTNEETGIDKDSYLYLYMKQQNPNEDEYGINTIFNASKDKHIADAKQAFENDILNGTISITVELDGKTVTVLDASKTGRNYAQPAQNLIDHYETHDKTTRVVVEGNGDGSLNASVVKFNGKNILLIEGSSEANDKDDWKENIDLGLNGLSGNDFVPQVYTDSYNYYKEVS